MKPYSILIIEDDVSIGDMLQEALELDAYSVSRAYSGTEALMLLEHVKPDLILLDLMLPGLSGEELISRFQGILTIVLSAKSDLDSKIHLLKMGASDYVTKPFVLAELLARIEAQLRLGESKRGHEISGEKNSRVSVGDITLDNSLFTLSKGKAKVSLTRTETAILWLLMTNAGRPLGRSTILDGISLDTPDCTERSLKQHVSNLRRKLQQIDEKEHIETIYGIGFQYNES